MGLEVFLHGKRAGKLSRSEDGDSLVFEYDEGYLGLAGAVALSRRLPLVQGPSKWREAGRWFDGLLPEGDRRHQIARQAGAASMSTYSMLEAIGAECAGAVEVRSGGGPAPAKVRAQRQEIGDYVAEMVRHPLGRGTRRMNLSLAGAQAKFVLVKEPDGGWSWPIGGYPSTHIVKPEQERFPGLVQNEHACMELARRAGLPAARTWTERFGKYEALVVERFDRGGEGNRIHQEDFAQALGVREKYQKQGGPSLKDYFTRTGMGGWALWDQVTFAWLIGDEDKHAKNFSIQYPERGPARLAPIYDAVCTLAYGELSREMAWRLGNSYRVSEVTKRGIEVQARRCGLDPGEALQRLCGLAERMRNAREEMKKEGGNITALAKAGLDSREAIACEWAR